MTPKRSPDLMTKYELAHAYADLNGMILFDYQPTGAWFSSPEQLKAGDNRRVFATWFEIENTVRDHSAGKLSEADPLSAVRQIHEEIEREIIPGLERLIRLMKELGQDTAAIQKSLDDYHKIEPPSEGDKK